jgi:hypothetical protein
LGGEGFAKGTSTIIEAAIGKRQLLSAFKRWRASCFCFSERREKSTSGNPVEFAGSFVRTAEELTVKMRTPELIERVN